MAEPTLARHYPGGRCGANGYAGGERWQVAGGEVRQAVGMSAVKHGQWLQGSVRAAEGETGISVMLRSAKSMRGNRTV